MDNQISFFSLFRYSVRVVKSKRAGVGKSLYISRVGSKLDSLMQHSRHALRQVFHSVDTNLVVTTSLHGNEVNQDKVVKSLLPYEKTQEDAFPRIYHFDIASTVNKLHLSLTVIVITLYVGNSVQKHCISSNILISS